MEIKRHVTGRPDDDFELFKFVKENGITYKEDSIVFAFDIYESSTHWPFIREYLRANNGTALNETEFSREELENAEWLKIRSQWRNGYPQPESGFKYETITYTRDNYCTECGSGLKQIDSFRIKKEPNWGKRCFMMLNWIADELFVNESTKKLLEHEVNGISFCEVKDKKGIDIIPDIYQMVIPVSTREGLIEDPETLHDALVCPSCGIKRFHTNGRGMLTFKKESLVDAPAVVKTCEIFGWGKSSSHQILINRDVYQLLTKNKLDRGLEFKPIRLI